MTSAAVSKQNRAHWGSPTKCLQSSVFPYLKTSRITACCLDSDNPRHLTSCRILRSEFFSPVRPREPPRPRTHRYRCSYSSVSGVKATISENGSPFQYSCLENHMDRAWQATVHDITELDMTKELTLSSSFKLKQNVQMFSITSIDSIGTIRNFCFWKHECMLFPCSESRILNSLIYYLRTTSYVTPTFKLLL